MPYGILNSILTDNGPQFTPKFFEIVCTMLRAKHLTTTTYHLQTNGQNERYSRTPAMGLRHLLANMKTIGTTESSP